MLVVFAMERSGAGGGGTVSDNGPGNGAGWTKLGSQTFGVITLSAYARNQAWTFDASGTITYTGSAGSTACCFAGTWFGGGITNVAELVKQLVFDTGTTTPPSSTFLAATQTDAVVLVAFAAGDGFGGIPSSPSGTTGGTTEQTAGPANALVKNAVDLSLSAGTTITWGATTATAWITAALELNLTALGTDMGSGSFFSGLSQHAATVDEGADVNPPIATAISPTPDTPPGASGGMPSDYTSASTTPIVFDITDEDGQDDIVQMVITAIYPTRGDFIYRNGGFGPGYDVASTITSITNGWQFSIVNNGVWPGAVDGQPNTTVKIQIDACDGGGLTASTTFDYEMPFAPVPAPSPGPPAPIPSPIPTSSPVYIDHVEAALDRLPLQFRKP